MKTLKILTILILGLLNLQTFALSLDSISPAPTYQFINDTLLKVDWSQCEAYYIHAVEKDEFALTVDNWTNWYTYYYSSNDSMYYTFNISSLPDTFKLIYHMIVTDLSYPSQVDKEDTIQLIKPSASPQPTPIIIDTLYANDTLFVLQGDTAIVYYSQAGDLYNFLLYYPNSLIIAEYDYVDSIYYYNWQSNKSINSTPILTIYKIDHDNNNPNTGTTTNINNLTNTNQFTFYPNPSRSYINIQTQNVSNIYIFNSIGKLVLSQKVNNNNNNKINVSNLTKGIYFIKTDILLDTSTYKLIVE